MSDKVIPGPIQGNPCFNEAVCVHTKMIYDSSRSKECLSDLRVYFCNDTQALVDRAVNAKCKKACAVWVDIDVEPIPFNPGYFSVDAHYFYSVTAEIYLTPCSQTEVEGIACYTKRTILFGGKSNARTFTSDQLFAGARDAECNCSCDTNVPTGVVELVDPIVLGCRLRECPQICDVVDIPEEVARAMGGSPVFTGDKTFYITLGQFSIVRLERDAPMLIPTYEFCMPSRPNPPAQENDPCDLFEKIKFPTDEFFPRTPSSGSGRC